MSDQYSGLVAHYELPEFITILKDGEPQAPEYTDKYIDRIGEELRATGHIGVTNNDIAAVLKRLFNEGFVDESIICKRLLEDEPQPFQAST